MTPKCVTPYPISSEDKHWADHIENQQGTSEYSNDDEVLVKKSGNLLVAFIWKHEVSIDNFHL